MVDPMMFFIYALAGYRITRAIIEDVIFEGVRNRIWNRFPPTHGLGYLITCPWCTGMYVATALCAGYILIPSVMSIIATALALAASIGIINKLLDRD